MGKTMSEKILARAAGMTEAKAGGAETYILLGNNNNCIDSATIWQYN